MQNRSVTKKITVVILGLFLCLVMLEIGIRIVGFVFLSLQEHRNVISIKQRGAYCIMCLGESMTAGMWPRPLEKILNERAQGIKFSVIDKGLPGTNTIAIIDQLENNLNKYNPDMVIVMMGFNDGRDVLPYGNVPVSEKIPFKIYRLARILRYNIINKARKEANDLKQPGNFKEMERMFKKAIEINPKNNSACTEFTLLFKNQKIFKEAEEVLKKAIEVNPKNYKAYIGLGWFYREQGRFEEAVEMFKKAIEVNPKNDWPYTDLGWFYKKQRRFKEAAEMFKKAIEINPRNELAITDLGWFYTKQGRFKEAVEMFKKAIEINPKNDRVYGILAYCYNKLGKQKLAKEYFRKANRLRLGNINPITRHNYQRLKEILTQRGIRLVCVQYPARSVAPLKKMLKPYRDIIFVDNERIFKEAVKEASYDEYFSDISGGDFGHCTRKGNRLLAENIADVILRECF